MEIRQLCDLIKMPDFDPPGKTLLRLCMKALTAHQRNQGEEVTRAKLRTIVQFATDKCVDELVYDMTENGELGTRPKRPGKYQLAYQKRIRDFTEVCDEALAIFIEKAVDDLYRIITRRVTVPSELTFRIDDCYTAGMMAYLHDIALQAECYVEEAATSKPKSIAK